MNYKKTPWDDVSDKSLDTEACHSKAHQELSQFKDTDREMDAHQRGGYQKLQAIAAKSSDPDARNVARAALWDFAAAERLEAENEAHVHEGHGAVARGSGHNKAVIGIAEANRNPKASGKVTA